MQTGTLFHRLKPVILTAALLGLVAAPLAMAASSGAFRARSPDGAYEDASREYRNALPPPDRAITFRGDCAYEEHVRVNADGWTLVEHVMRCVEKIPPGPCLVVASDGATPRADGSPAHLCPPPNPEPAPCAEPAQGQPVESTREAAPDREPRSAALSPRPCPAPESAIHFALASEDGRVREIHGGDSIPLDRGLKLVARSREPAELHFVATRNGENVAEWRAKVAPEHAFTLAVQRLADVGATELAVRASFANGAAAGYHFRLVSETAPATATGATAPEPAYATASREEPIPNE